MLAANHLQVVFPHPPFSGENQGIIVPWEIWSAWGFPHLLVSEAPGGTGCEGAARSRAGAALRVSVLLPSEPPGRVGAGWGMTKLFCCSFWDFKVCFGSVLQQKEKLLNVVCNISLCWNTSFWTAWMRISQVAARCKMAGDSFVLQEQRLGCILFVWLFSLTQHSCHQRKLHSCFVGQK